MKYQLAELFSLIPFQKDRDSERLYKWQHCFLTQEPLGKHIVACQLGRVYNKEAVIERLLDKTQLMPRSAAHIKSIKVSFPFISLSHRFA